ncbi:hypothetical protein DL764_008051 [Monosporascus ibericus]|uniref:Uncharacterized protein n=1 Tax=Monosporascus ibericus TaxID=155417 RepID=A0A4Q4T1A8_9PEZI|nr:hypothetical protein DL764_008051 [Monosporascus ibericus]
MDDIRVEAGGINAAGRGGGGGLGGGTVATPRKLTEKSRSLSDGGGTQLSPSPRIIEAARCTSKDDSSLPHVIVNNSNSNNNNQDRDIDPPVTPHRPDSLFRASGMNLSLQMPQRDQTSPIPAADTPAVSAHHLRHAMTPTPLSPKLDHSQIYASPTNILPRRSRGLDFSRAATSLHHSTLAEQSSPDSSPTIGGRAMNIPGRGSGEYGAEQSSNSLWSMMGVRERSNLSGSVGSANNMVGSDSSSSSDGENLMDDDMEDAIMSTPHVARSNSQLGNQTIGRGNSVVPWLPDSSPAVSSLSNFRSRPRRQSKRKLRGLLGLGFKSATPATLSKSPPNNVVKEKRDAAIPQPRRESISWAANQLRISSTEAEEKGMDAGDILSASGKDGQRGVVKRVVTRRGNLLPKTKGFARIRAALAEESMPVDSEVQREAEVIRQVRESDINLEPRVPPAAPTTPAAPTGTAPPPLDIPQTSTASPNLNTTREGLDDVTEDDMMTDSAFLPRGSSSGISEDVNMDSPSLSAGSANTSVWGPGAGFTLGGNGTENQRSDMPQQTTPGFGSQGGIPPTAAEITRRINNKRRRDDDFDPVSFKRRAVSPGMSVHNSPIMQSPMQRDMAPWGSRPGSNHGGDKHSATPSDSGNSAGNNGGRAVNGPKGRVGFQGMVDTNDGLMRMSIE